MYPLSETGMKDKMMQDMPLSSSVFVHGLAWLFRGIFQPRNTAVTRTRLMTRGI